MKAISIKQPWTGLIASGLKPLETRTWETKHRGDLLICSSKKPSTSVVLSDFAPDGIGRYVAPVIENFGKALCVVDLVDCRPYRKEDEAKTLCDYYPGYVWEFRNLRRVVPFDVKGRQGFYNVQDKNIVYLASIPFTELDLPANLLEHLDDYVDELYFASQERTNNGPCVYSWVNFNVKFSVEDVSKQKAKDLISYGFSFDDIVRINESLKKYLLPQVH
jgi:hypothetical protein